MFSKKRKKQRTDLKLLPIIALFFFSTFSCWADEASNICKSDKKTEAFIAGKVVDTDGKGVPGIKVSCYIHLQESFLMPLLNKDIRDALEMKTDPSGHYKFPVPMTQKPCEIHVGGTASTAAQSEPFTLKSNGITQVEPLLVRPANKFCKGRVVYEDGQPAANLSYGYLSESFIGSSMNSPKTNDQGEFNIPYLLPDELFSFWIFPKENTFCVWKRLDPNIEDHQFIAKPSDFIELPSDWLYGGSTHEAIARQTTYAKDSRIQFSLPDLHGKVISLKDEQYKNKAILVNIFGSWCGGCNLEIPYLVRFKNKYHEKGLEVIGIAFEFGSAEEQVEAIQKVSRKYHLNYPLLMGGLKDNEKVEVLIDGLKDFKGYPTTLYIDRNGIVKHIQVGFWIASEPHKKWQLKQMEDNIKNILVHNGEK